MLVSKNEFVRVLTTYTEKETKTGVAFNECVARAIARANVKEFVVNSLSNGDAFEALEKLRVGDNSSNGIEYDLIENNKKIELKLSTTRSLAHRVNPNQKVDLYRVLGMSKNSNGVEIVVYDIPNIKDLMLDKKNRPYANQKLRFVNKELTNYYNKLMK